MVNVGGRSRGCSTCRRRRVKCDETSPVCRYCERLGLACSGPKGISFVRAKIVRTRGRTEKEPTQSSLASQRGTTNQVNLTSSTLRSTDLEIYVCHTQKYLCLGGIIDATLQEVQLRDVEAIARSGASQRPAHQAVLSFGIITFGMQQQQSDIVNQGYAMYSTAARGLNHALSDPETYLSDEVVLSVTTMAFLECLVPSGPETFAHHITGLERLVELRGRAAHNSVILSQLYRVARMLIIFGSLRQQRRSVLGNAEWQAMFRTHSSFTELLEQDIYDALGECTRLFTADHELNSVSGHGYIEQRIWSILTHLNTFRERCGKPHKDYSNSAPSTLDCMNALQAMWDSGPPFHCTGSDSRAMPAVDMVMLYYFVFIQIFRLLRHHHLQCHDEHFSYAALQAQLQELQLPSETQIEVGAGFAGPERLAALHVYSYIPQYLLEKSRYKTGSSPHAHWALTTAWETLGGDAFVAGRRIREILKAEDNDINPKILWKS